MSVVIETTLGDITVDLFLDQRPITCLNFLKLCKMKYYNFNLFHSIRSGFIAQTGDPTGEGSGGQSIWGLLNGPDKRFFSGEKMPKIRHTDAGLLSMVCTGEMMVGSQFFFTLGPDLDSLDGVHCVIGEVTEGHEILRKLNDVICDETHRPYQDVRITHTVILEDPFSDPPGLRAPSRSPSPSAERLKGGRIAPDEELDETEGKTAAEVQEMIEEKEAKARATILEIVGDLPDADIAPPENVLFVCKLNPVTTDEDLEIIFSRFGKIVSCEVIRDKKTGDSLQYAFIEFDDKKSCEDAYFKMDNVLIDDRRIHVDFSQSVSKMRWLGKGRGVQHFNDDGEKIPDVKRDRSRRSRSKEHQIQRHHSNRDKYADSKRNERNVTNRRNNRERSKSRTKIEYQENSKDYDNSRYRQKSQITDEYTRKEKQRERSSSKSKSSNHKTEKLRESDKKDKSRRRHEDNDRGKHNDQSEARNQDKSHHRSDQLESNRENKSRSSRQYDDEIRKEDGQRNRNDERKSRDEDHQRSRNESKKDLDAKYKGKSEYHSSKKYDDKLDDTEDVQRYRKEEFQVSKSETEKNKYKSRNEQLSESNIEIPEKSHKANYDMERQNTRSEGIKNNDKKEKNKSENDKTKHKNTFKDRYDRQSNDREDMTGKEKSNRNTDKQISRYEEKYEIHSRYEKHEKSMNQGIDNNDLQSKQKHRHEDRNNERNSKKDRRQEGKEKDGLDKHRTSDKDNTQKQKKLTEPASQDISKGDQRQTGEGTSQGIEKKKRKKGEVKSKGVKKKVSDKKTNKRENRKRKRKPSTSSDTDSDSSDSSSSSESSSSSSESDHKRKSKRRKKYSSSSSSSDSSTTSSSESSTTSSSSSDSDAKKRKIKKKRTMKKSKRK